ncbi:unnamed protein product, partial [Timema podura]|nr:unnamed protein product [Timema podura]
MPKYVGPVISYTWMQMAFKRALTMKTTEARNERVFTPLSIDQALDARTKRTASISILDIFGFEDFKENSFEQLCINYANENLQFYFNKHIFKLEQQEYAKEKIEWQTITYTKCHYNHALDELYSRPRMSSMEFGVKHYAGQVWYGVDGFLDKNRDTLRPDVVELLISSKMSMLSKMFQYVRSSHEAVKTINKANGRFVTMKPRTPTVAARFHDSLQQLLDSMTKCNPWFVRCIKPNSEKAPMKFDMPIVLEQLRYTGMLETIRIRKMGYPVRLRFSHFVERYRYLLPQRGKTVQRGTPFRELCRVILDSVAPQSAQGNDYQLGTTRVFLRENLERHLERDRAKILRGAAITLQRHVRGYLARRRYQATKKGALLIQKHVRGWRARTRYNKVRKGVVFAQANFRGKRQRKRYLELKEELKRRSEVEKIARERAKARQQKEEQERASRAVAGVNHLEIPAELAFIFSKLDDWQPVHSERNLVKVVGGVRARSERHHLPHDIDYHAFTKFTNIYFKSHLWGMKREPIKTPFLAKSKDMDYQDSLALFKLILRFMNDNNLSGKKEIALGDYIVNKGIVNEKMRDEIVCQLCNQTWKNDNDANNERGWLLMANCLSVFPPSKTLYKYLLKFVSDHGYNGYKALCQRKLLQSARVESNLARNYPPCLLEWRANRKRVNMALNVQCADGETLTTAVDSWTTSEELASHVVRERGITECSGWTVSLADESSSTDNLSILVKESCGLDYVLDLVAEMELAPAFPVCKNSFLVSGGRVGGARRMGAGEEAPLPSPRRPGVPPPEPPASKQATRKESRELKESNKSGKLRSQSRDHTVEIGLSRKSALNDRYFEDKGRSRSLDNLLESELPPTHKLESLGLSHSRLNDRYHSMEKVSDSQNDVSMILMNAVSNKEYMTKAEALLEENLESVSQRGDSRKATDMNGRSNSSVMLDNLPSDLLTRGGSRQDLTLDFEYPDILSSQTRSEDDKGTSHVRRVRVPSQASDVDQFLDDLFMPVLDGNLDELSDARSLAASLKGGGDKKRKLSDSSVIGADYEVAILTGSAASSIRLTAASALAGVIKGGGGMEAQQTTSRTQATAFSFSPIANMTSPTPVMMSGMMSPPPMMMPTLPLYSQAVCMRVRVEDSVVLHVAVMVTEGEGGEENLGGDSKARGLENKHVHVHERLTSAQTTAGLSFMGSGGAATMPPYFPGGAPVMPDLTGHSLPQTTAGAQGFMPVPIYNMQGMSLPPYSPLQQPSGPAQQPNVDPSLAAYQQSIQQVFLQSAMAQNMQIQQQLLAQNQALQHMLHQQAQPPGPWTCQTFNNFTLVNLLLVSPDPTLLPPKLNMFLHSHSLIGLLFRGVETKSTSCTGLHVMSMSGVPPQMAGLQPAYDSLGRNSKVSFREPENTELWSTEKRQTTPVMPQQQQQQHHPVSSQSPAPPLPPKSRFSSPPQQAQQLYKQETTVKAQVHRSQSPNREFIGSSRKLTPTKTTSHTAFTSVLSELKSRKSSTESSYSFSHKVSSPGVPPPPPPPMPPPPDHGDPSEARPFLDPYGRAKTVRIGKWRWPPPKMENEDSSDSFLQFKLRQHHRKTTPQQQQYNPEFGEPLEGIEWEEFELSESTPPTKEAATRKESRSSRKEFQLEGKDKNAIKSFEVGVSRPSPASIGKLRISSEMRSKLEMVTANHSVRATNKPEKPGVLPIKKDESPQRPVKKLEDNRKLLLEQQLSGRWDTVDSVEMVNSAVSKEERSDVQQTNIVRSQVTL